MKDLFQLFTAFFKIGLFTIGGGLAMLPMIQRVVTDEKKWLDEGEMLDCIAVCQSLPGVIAINAAVYVGKARKGLPGAFFASLGVITPSFVIIIIASISLAAIGENMYLAGAFTGIKAAACALILYSAVRLGKQALKSKFSLAIAAACFVMIVFFKITALWAILSGALAGMFYALKKAKSK